MVSPVSSSSPTSTQRMEKGGLRWANPSTGGLEHDVTNWKYISLTLKLIMWKVILLYYIRSSFKKCIENEGVVQRSGVNDKCGGVVGIICFVQ